MTIYDLAYEEDHSELYNVLSNPTVVIDPARTDMATVNQICFACHLKRSGVDYKEDMSFELVQFVGYFREYQPFRPTVSRFNSLFCVSIQQEVILMSMI